VERRADGGWSLAKRVNDSKNEKQIVEGEREDDPLLRILTECAHGQQRKEESEGEIETDASGEWS
jgi:hypothetical protein